METTEMEQSMQWFVFFKDQLLLKKEYTTNGENKYGIPHGVTPPVTPAAGCKIHEVTLTGGKKVKACALGQPVPETEEWVMTGLRASYDYLHWQIIRQREKHSRYSIGTATAVSVPYAALLWNSRLLS